jgi:release factor glutamine methyltransferase
MPASFIDKNLDKEDFLFPEWLRRVSARWQGSGDGAEMTPEEALRTLWLSVCSNESMTSEELPALEGDQIERLEDFVSALENGVPLAHLTGRATFMGLELRSGPGALIPQRETELLGARALVILRELVPQRGSAIVFDLCTGAGNLALGLAHAEPNCRVFATDLSEEAAALARQNAEHLKLSDRLEILAGDLFAPLTASSRAGAADLIVCNPPYISSAKVDEMPRAVSRCGPRLAFDGGPYGLNILSRLVRESPAHLKPESFLCFEVGAGQGPCLLRLMQKMPEYAVVQTASDPQGTVRVLIGRTG